MFRIQTYNTIAQQGLDILASEQCEVGSQVQNPQGLLLRSQVLNADDIPDSVIAVARAGAGVNNIPVQELTERGVVVFNTPGANANSVCELVLAALLNQVRNLFSGLRYSVESLDPTEAPEAIAAQLEKEKKRFRGYELSGRSLGVVGLGAIGSRVARAAIQLGMNVVGYDPAISVDAAWQLPSEVEQAENIEDLVRRSDFITLHVPAIDATRNMVNAEFVKWMRPGAALLNFARGAVVDNSAVLAGLKSEKLSGYSTDFPTSELIVHAQQSGNVHLYPHLGASTEEAEVNCAQMAANQLMRFLSYGNVINSVNFPRVTTAVQGASRMVVINRNVPKMIGQMAEILANDQINVLNMANKSRGEVAITLFDSETPLQDDVVERIRNIEGVLSARILKELT